MKKSTRKKSSSKKTTGKKTTVKKATKKPTKKSSPKKATKKTKTNGMNTFEQCVVLAAIINQQRNKDKKFLFVPLPDINSTMLAPLREILSHYAFTAHDITKATHAILSSKTFKECFALTQNIKEALLNLTEETSSEILGKLFLLAGPEAKKAIYMAEDNARDIHKTTLEKHALKLGLIEPHVVTPEPFQQQDQHKKIIIKLHFNKLGRDFIDNSQRFSGTQKRGRG